MKSLFPTRQKEALFLQKNGIKHLSADRSATSINGTALGFLPFKNG